ncbi:hypothetical protein OBG91_11540 [Lactococcus lactis]|nr:hypothetical protein [Lactococcus lactis]
MKQPSKKRKYALRSSHDVTKLRFKNLTKKSSKVVVRSTFARSKFKTNPKSPSTTQGYAPTKQQQIQLEAAFEKSQGKTDGKDRKNNFLIAKRKRILKQNVLKNQSPKRTAPHIAKNALKTAFNENEDTKEAVNRYEKVRMPDRALNLSKRVYDKVVSPHSKMDRIKNAEKGAKAAKKSEAILKGRQIKQRSQSSKALVKVGRHLISLVKWGVSAISSIPFILPILGIFAAIIIILSIFTSLIPVKQSEFELTKVGLQLLNVMHNIILIL